MARRNRRKAPDRVTVTLAPGQRKVLEIIAKRNYATLAFVVRYALNTFIQNPGNGELHLAVPDLPESDSDRERN